MLFLFALGFISILGQVVLLRELSVAFYGVELIYTLALGIWLLSTACGAMIHRHAHIPPSLTRTNLLFLLFSIALILDVAFVRSVRAIFTNLPGSYLPLQTQIAAMCIALLPIGLILGLLFQWTAREYLTNGRSLAGAYGVESIGGLAGGLCATLFLKFGFQNLVIALICALAAAGSSFLCLDRRRIQWFRAVSLTVFAVLMVLLVKAPEIDRQMTSWTHPNLVSTWDSPYSRITVSFLDGQVSVFENDALLFDTEETRAEEFVQLAALQHPNPRRVLVLGGGIDGSIREILKHSPTSVDYVELNPALLRVAQDLPVEIQKSLRAESVRIFQEDPRQFLNRSQSYDLILVGMPEPSSGQANRFYTQEFFRQCAGKLNKEGIIAFTLQSSENIWTPQLTRRMVSIYRAAKSVFPEVLFIPGGRNVVIGSTHLLTRDPSVLASRLQARGIKTRIISADYLHYLFTNDRFAEVARALESGTAPINTDVRPICYQYTIMIWLSKFLPSAKFWDFSGSWSGRGLAFFVVLSLPALLLSRARWHIRCALLTGVAGFVGMTLEALILLYFQTKSGILFQDIGILLTGFMAGLAFGSFGTEKIYKIYGRAPRSLGFALLAGFIALSGFAGWWINSGRGAGLPESLASLFVAGALVAGVFSYAGLRELRDQARAITPLYSADLIGGCIGSLLASLALAPLAGLALTSYLMIPVILLSVLLL